ncbi:uncharacterized protein BDR25DRAFT_375618 [Lindgomyces ingoldianus]|uniref:Uncharacterized protein n=1 Tax=Lindgomyces ingoldianus TaxID=673940 RepID=A0ACB6RCY9_9PLEO|nr:uncharacterized protein BDR25DRAFT_375618 [Lindgomyces ingoldianus]KAF2476618.1 hypothetical protein BDR25DRAFT_375618 [Lindgomyces ingoldianus]
MRLVDVHTFEFKWFSESELPKYVILSYRWGDEEVSYQDMCWLQKMKSIPDNVKNDPVLSLLLSPITVGSRSVTEREIMERPGYAKIVGTARFAKALGCRYTRVDTCRIGKSSSAELQEAINSILEDFDLFARILSQFRWITRGWTPQELVAPTRLFFCNRDWGFMTAKHHTIGIKKIAQATGIPLRVLRTGDLSDMSIAQSMSWAANRSTTRVEDTAYRLMGLFDIHMPMLYGEGSKAFIRLQEAIMQTNSDQTTFAW